MVLDIDFAKLIDYVAFKAHIDYVRACFCLRLSLEQARVLANAFSDR